MGTHRLQEALKQLREAIRAVDAVIDEMRAEHDALALHVSSLDALPAEQGYEEWETARQDGAPQLSQGLRARISR